MTWKDRIRGGEGGSRGRAYIYIIMADLHFIWQKPTQHYKAIFLQLKNKFKQKE